PETVKARWKKRTQMTVEEHAAGTFEGWQKGKIPAMPSQLSERTVGRQRTDRSRIGGRRLRSCPAWRDHEWPDQLAQEAAGKGLVNSVVLRLFVFRHVESAEETINPRQESRIILVHISRAIVGVMPVVESRSCDEPL